MAPPPFSEKALPFEGMPSPASATERHKPAKPPKKAIHKSERFFQIQRLCFPAFPRRSALKRYLEQSENMRSCAARKEKAADARGFPGFSRAPECVSKREIHSNLRIKEFPRHTLIFLSSARGIMAKTSHRPEENHRCEYFMPRTSRT